MRLTRENVRATTPSRFIHFDAKRPRHSPFNIPLLPPLQEDEGTEVESRCDKCLAVTSRVWMEDGALRTGTGLLDPSPQPTAMETKGRLGDISDVAPKTEHTEGWRPP